MKIIGMKKYHIFSLLALLLITALFVSIPIRSQEIIETQITGAAVSSFYATTAATSVACAGTPTQETILIRNQGTVPDVYTLSIEGEGAPWISVDGPISLAAGEEQTVSYYILPPQDADGMYEYTLTVSSYYDGTRSFEKSFTVNQCPNIDLQAYNTVEQTCPCTTGVYIFQLTNTGTTTETYALSIPALYADYYDLSEYLVTLAPGEEKDIYAYVRMACFVYGDFSFTLVAETQNSGYTAEIPLALTVQQACYAYNIALGEALVFSEQELTVTFTPTTDTNYEFCQETPAVIPVYIQNPGDIKNTYSITVEDAEQWITPAEPTLLLQPSSERVSSIIVNTNAANTGTYSFALKVETERGDLQTVLPFTVTVNDCTAEERAPMTVFLWVLLALVLLAILLAGFLLYRKNKEKESKEGQKKLTKKGKGEAAEQTWAQKNKKWLLVLLPLLLLLLLIGLLAYPSIQEHVEERAQAGTQTETYTGLDRTVPTLLYPWATALILLAALALLALLLWWFKLRNKPKNGKKKDKALAKKENTLSFYDKHINKGTWEKVKPILKWIWIILLLLLLLTGLAFGLWYMYKNYQADADRYLDGENVTEEGNETTIENVTEEVTASETEEELQQQIADLEQRIAETEQQIEELQEELVTHAEDAAVHDTTDQENEDLVQRIVDLEEQLRALEDRLSEMEEERDSLIARLTDVEEKVDTVAEDVSALEERIAALEEQVAALQETIEELSQQDTQEADAVIEDIQDEIDDLENQIADLEDVITPDQIIIVPEITDDNYKTVLLFDVSLSGQIVENGQTRFERGVEAATNFIQEEGTYSVMIVGKNAIIVRRNVDSATALRTIKALRPLDTQSNLGRALYEAAEELEPNYGRLVLISDLQTTDGTDIFAIHNELEESGIDVVFINIAGRSSPVETTEEEPSEENEPVEEESESPVFDVTQQTAEGFTIEIPKNTDYSLDLQSYFVDPDQDELSFTATAGEHLTVAIQDSVAILTPEQNWVGETWVAFAADDGKGGIVESPALKVIVFEPTAAVDTTEESADETEPGPSYQDYLPWVILGSIILLIILSLIFGAFAKKFHSPQIPPSEEEHKKEKKE